MEFLDRSGSIQKFKDTESERQRRSN